MALVGNSNSFYYEHYLDGNRKHLDYLHSELDKRIYYYGNHFKSSYEKSSRVSLYKTIILETLLFLFVKVRYAGKKDPGVRILSNNYFGLKHELKKEGFYCFDVPWAFRMLPSICSISEFLKIQLFKIRLRTGDLNFLVSADMSAEIDKIENLFESLLLKSNIKGIVLSTDSDFFERITIDIAKRIGVKTFILMHGTAPRYLHTLIDNRSDYLLLFGELFVEKFIKSGMDPRRLINVGHPIFSRKLNQKLQKPRFGLGDVLILSKTIPGQPLQIWPDRGGRSGDSMRVSDRGNSITYLLILKQVLSKIGVKKVRLRLHPSENAKWYGKHIDTTFFEFDNTSIAVSLEASSLVIGPTSSTFFDAIFCGVNYLIFEPLYDDGTDILNKGIGHPFDNSEERIPAANTTEKLEAIIAEKQCVDISIIPEFINSEFSLRKISQILNSTE